MPAADSLAALMKKWPLNNITLFVATHSKLRKASDGTGTQVATCMINKWTAKINENEIYNGKCPPRMGKEKKGEEKNGRRLQFLLPLQAFVAKHQRIEKKKNWEEEELVLGQSPKINFYLSSTLSIIPSSYNHVQLLKLSLKPSSWSHFLYQIYYIRLVGFRLICLTVKNLPKVDLTTIIVINLLYLYSFSFYYFTIILIIM